MPKCDRERKRAKERLERQLRMACNTSLDWPARKRASRYAACLAERLGILRRPALCDGCGRRTPLTRHHDDHARPLDIQWLCFDCHREADRLQRHQRAEEESHEWVGIGFAGVAAYAR